MTKRNAIILAAGKGTRMRSKLYKVLHQVCGKTMVEHVLTQLEKAKIDNIITIVGFGAETVEQQLGHRTKYALQEQQLGTGHAVMQTKDLLANEDGETIIVSVILLYLQLRLLKSSLNIMNSGMRQPLF